jgi:hypothetical protein
MKARLLVAIVMALVLLILPAIVLAESPIKPSINNESSGDEIEADGFGSPDVLWSQPRDGSGGMASQYFPDYSGGIYSADDFSLTDHWVIESIFVPGYHSGASLLNSDSLHWVIYSDNSGEPAGHPEAGGHLWSYTCSPGALEVTIGGSGNTDITLDIVQALGTGLTLQPGTYWLCFYPSMNAGSYGQWWWERSGTNNLAIAQQIDPNNLLGAGYTTWTPITVTGSDGSFHDMAFQLDGGLGYEYGDAPEGALAYPNSLVTGAFPTCKNVHVAGYIEHNNFGAWFGPSYDFEGDGNAGYCPMFHPDKYDQDECFNDGDAGIIKPVPYTMRSGMVVACGSSSNPCEYEICLEDDYGDGWNGGYVDVSVNGNPVYTSLTLSSGSGPVCHSIPVENGDEITVDYTAGSWSYENEYYIYDKDGILVRSEGTGGVEPGDVLSGELYAVCPFTTLTEGTPLGTVCHQAQWGRDIDIDVHNTMPGHPEYLPAYVNVLVDWNQDGQWGGSSACSGANTTPEHVLVNFVVPPQYIGTLSALGPPDFTIGPKQGYVWTRFSITESPVIEDWDGDGVFEDGETEDYLLRIDPELPIGGEAMPVDKAGVLLPYIMISALIAGALVMLVRKRLTFN